jgi:hypothetical protein
MNSPFTSRISTILFSILPSMAKQGWEIRDAGNAMRIVKDRAGGLAGYRD